MNFNIYHKKFSNKLTAAIKQGITIDKLLFDEELSVTLRNEAEELINYICPPEEMKNPNPNLPVLDQLIKLSLDPNEGKSKEYKLHQLNRNASNVLSFASNKLQEKLREDGTKRFFKALRNFIFSPHNRNIMFAGHFQRIFDTAIRKSRDVLLDKEIYNDKFNENFLPFLIKNSDILPYKELLTSIICEFSDCFPSVIDEALRYAAIATLNFYEQGKIVKETKNKQEKFSQDKKKDDILEVQKNTSLKKLIEDQPVNCKQEKIPIPHFMTDKKDIKSIKITDDSEFINQLKSDLNFTDLEYSELLHSSEKSDDKNIDNTLWLRFALNLIYAFKDAFESDTKNTIKNKVEQDEKEGKESNIIKFLLICGMYADSDSPLSYTSFNILFNILNEPHKDHDDSYDDKYILNLNPPSIIDAYAEHFVFDPFEVTERMISGLLIFWNHRYTNLPFKADNAKKKKSLPNYTSKEGISPLELLLPSVLTEPIYSTKLNAIFMRIISSMEQEIIDTIEKEEEKIANQNANQDQDQDQDQDQSQMEAQEQSQPQKDEDNNNNDDEENNDERCFIFDSIWYELLTYRFKLLPTDEKTSTLQTALERLLPLSATDEFYDLKKKNLEFEVLYRCPTNPVLFMLSKTINHGAFFSFKNGRDFKKLLTEPYAIEWVKQTFEYCHIIDRMEKQLVSIPYEKTKKRRLKVDEKASEDEMELQSRYSDHLTNSLRFK